MNTRPIAGTLQHARRGHGAILVDEKVLIIGGRFGGGYKFTQINNEVCTFRDSTMTCVEQPAVLKSYTDYPELFLVLEDFGKDSNKC